MIDDAVAEDPSLDRYFQLTFGGDGLPASVRDLAKRALTASRIPLERRTARTVINHQRSLLLHLGCADTYLDGWCNIDYARPGRRLDLRWDLRRPLPFPDAAVEAIFSEHVLEHIPYPGAMRLLRECYRLLKIGGVCRIGVPDFERYLRSYLGQDPLIDETHPNSPTKALAVAEVLYRFGHRSTYDVMTLSTMAHAAGFSLVEGSSFGKGRIIPNPDSPGRRSETLYVDAVK